MAISKKYEPSRLLMSFYIRGFQYWDGALVINELKPGEPITLIDELDNPHDSQAVALYYNETKLGYIPRGSNDMIATLLHFGHEGVFEARVLAVDPEAPTYEQVRVGVYAAKK